MNVYVTLNQSVECSGCRTVQIPPNLFHVIFFIGNVHLRLKNPDVRRSEYAMNKKRSLFGINACIDQR